MNETQIRILEKAVKIIETLTEEANDEIYDYLLDYTDGRPMTTQENLESLIDGIRQYKKQKAS